MNSTEASLLEKKVSTTPGIGIEAISVVTDKFLTNVASDIMINGRFAGTVANPAQLQLLRNNLIDQICAGAGGPCQYKGKTMVAFANRHCWKMIA